MARVKIILVCEECGQEFTHIHNCYNRDAADSYEEWAKENITVCPECYKKAQRSKERVQEDATAENVDSWIKSEGFELSDLAGTEKQVAWAKKIRLNGINCLYEIRNKFPKDKWADVWKHLNKYNTAKYWIDNRELFGSDSKEIMRILQNDMNKENQ
jgi:hypothetical protein